jgi:hypothetical protein
MSEYNSQPGMFHVTIQEHLHKSFSQLPKNVKTMVREGFSVLGLGCSKYEKLTHKERDEFLGSSIDLKKLMPDEIKQIELKAIEKLTDSLWDEMTPEQRSKATKKIDEEVGETAQRKCQEKSQNDAGCYTLIRAATELSVKSGLKIDRWLRLIMGEIEAGALPLKNPKDYTDPLPYPIPETLLDYYDVVSAADVNTWLTAHPEWGNYRLGDVVPTPDSMEQASSIAVTNPTNTFNDEPPGKMPRTAIGKLAIKAAWRIERATRNKATANQVITELQQQVETEPALVKKISHGVRWETTKGKEKPFDVEACAKALDTWNTSRA